MRINHAAIIGKGAVGLMYGSLIARNIGPQAIQFAMDDARFLRHAHEKPLINGTPCQIQTIPMSEAHPVDLVILACKATGLDAAIESMAPLVGPSTCIASLLNGITSEQRIAARYGWDHLVLGIAQGMDAVFLDSRLTYHHTGEIRFGAAQDTLPGVCESIADFYQRAGIAHTVEDDIRRRMWIKLALNCGINQTCMVFGGTYGTASAPGEQNRCFIAAMREVLAVGRAEGVQITEADLSQMAQLIASLDPDGMPSMAQDRLNRKKTEVEEFSGTICRLAEKHHILTPQNAWLYKRIREIEGTWPAPGVR